MAKWKNTSDTDKARIAKLTGDDLIAAAVTLNDVKLETLQRYIRTYKCSNIIDNSADLFPTRQRPAEFDPMEITTDDAIILGDIEVPDHSRAYLLQALFSAMAHNIKTLIIAGDFVATDQGALNSWPTTWKLKSDMSYKEACDMACDLLNQMSMWFDNIYIIEGNHDVRIAKSTKGEVDLGMMIAETEAEYSRISYMWINTCRGNVKVSHPRNFSKNPVVLCQKLHSTEPRKGHYIIGHCHRMQQGMGEDGIWEMHGLGTGRDYAKYKDRSDTTHAAWDIAFMMMKNGYFTHLGDKVTNWKAHFGNLYSDYLTALNPPSSAPKVVRPHPRAATSPYANLYRIAPQGA